MAGIIDGADIIDFSKYMHDTEESARVKPASAWVEELIAYRGETKSLKGYTLPWSKTHFDIQLREGELSIWAGVNGHGKSLLLGQVMLNLMADGRRCLIASFEMRPRATIARLMRQCSGSERFPDEYARKWGGWSDDKLWLYNQRDVVATDRIYALCRYAVSELDVHHIVIDSLMKCVTSEDDYNEQKYFIGELFAIAQDTGLHIHLVHHMRKGEDENKPGGKMSLKGSGAITDQPDNVFIIWKNKRKLQAKQSGEEVDEDKPDAMLICEKQRNGDTEPKYGLWFHPQSTQLLGSRGAPIHEYVT